MDKKNTMPPAFSEGHMSQNKKSKKRNDIILIAAILALATLAALVLLLTRTQGDRVIVTVNGETYGSYSLSKDTEMDIRTGESGKQLNRLIIKDGKAYVETATCPDGICASHKPISHDGESIICLPHKVVITVETDKTQRSQT